MNKRIEEFAEQAWDATAVSKDFGHPVSFAEKFAELIVRECYDTIKKDMELAHIQLIPIDFRIYANGRLRRIIKEYFEV